LYRELSYGLIVPKRDILFDLKKSSKFQV